MLLMGKKKPNVGEKVFFSISSIGKQTTLSRLLMGGRKPIKNTSAQSKRQTVLSTVFFLMLPMEEEKRRKQKEKDTPYRCANSKTVSSTVSFPMLQTKKPTTKNTNNAGAQSKRQTVSSSSRCY